MPALSLLLDANVLWKRALRNRLTEKIDADSVRVYVPTLVHAERIRQIADEKGEAFAIDVIQQLVEASKFELLPFSVEDAEAIADVWLDLKEKGFSQHEWREHRFDILLCAIARSRNYILITDDQGVQFEIVSAQSWNTTDLESWLEQA